jgi:hypothetical protein
MILAAGKPDGHTEGSFTSFRGYGAVGSTAGLPLPPDHETPPCNQWSIYETIHSR